MNGLDAWYTLVCKVVCGNLCLHIMLCGGRVTDAQDVLHTTMHINSLHSLTCRSRDMHDLRPRLQRLRINSLSVSVHGRCMLLQPLTPHSA